MISFQCPTCAQAYTVTADKAGKRTHCARCRSLLRVPNNLVVCDVEVEEVPIVTEVEVIDAEPAPASPVPKGLVACKECGGNVSRKAQTCPHCGVSRPGRASATLHLIRSSSVTGALHVVRVVVDGEFVGEVRNGGQVTVDIPAGAPVVEVSGGGMSRTQTVRVSDGQTVRYELYFSNWGALGGGLNFKPV